MRRLGLLLAAIAISLLACGDDGEPEDAAVMGLLQAPAVLSTFDGSPTSPQAFSDPAWDIQVHSRDRSSWDTLPSIQAQHGSDCSGPPASHANTSYAGSVFICNNHLMTAINGSAGYAAIVLTPNLMLDFTSGGSLTFDISTQRMSTRDWWDVWVTPYGDNLTIPLEDWLPDLQGEPRNAVQVTLNNSQGAPQLKTYRDGGTTVHNDGGSVARANQGVTATNQAATRQTFKLTIAAGRARFERLASDTAPYLLFWDKAININFSRGVVQLGHHSYTPEKDGAGVPATWHWDSVDVTPEVPFAMIKADRRALGSGGTVNFDAPAPANAHLRFSALCRVTIDGALAERQVFINHPERFSSYFVPIAEGKQSVNIEFTRDDWYTGPCHARDFAIWSTAAGPGPTPTATVTATPASTVAPTATPEPTPAPGFSTTRFGDWGYTASHPAGIKAPVVLRVYRVTDGVKINERAENTSPYCSYGDSGPGAASCYAPALTPGTYRVEAHITANDGSQTVASHEVTVN